MMFPPPLNNAKRKTVDSKWEPPAKIPFCHDEKISQVAKENRASSSLRESPCGSQKRVYVPRLVGSSDNQPSRLIPLPLESPLKRIVMPIEPPLSPLQKIFKRGSAEEIAQTKDLYKLLSQIILNNFNTTIIRIGIVELLKTQGGKWSFDVKQKITKILIGHLHRAFEEIRPHHNKKLFDLVLHEILDHTYPLTSQTGLIENHLDFCNSRFLDTFKNTLIDEIIIDDEPVPQVDLSMTYGLVFLVEKSVQWRQNCLESLVDAKDGVLPEKTVVGFILKKKENSLKITSALFDMDKFGKPLLVHRDESCRGFQILSNICNPGLEPSDNMHLDCANLEKFYEYIEQHGAKTQDNTPFFIIPDDSEELIGSKNFKGSFKTSNPSLMGAEILSGNLMLQFSSSSFLSYMNRTGAQTIHGLLKNILKARVAKIALHAPVLKNSLAQQLKSLMRTDARVTVQYKLLKKYQCDGINHLLDLWSRGIEGGILAPEMGLGKTLMMAGIAKVILEKTKRPALFFGTVSTIVQTEESMRYWLGKYILEDFKIECEVTVKKTLSNLEKYKNSTNNLTDKQELILPIQILKRKLSAFKQLHLNKISELNDSLAYLKMKKQKTGLNKKENAKKKIDKHRLRTAVALEKLTDEITTEMTTKFVEALQHLNLTQGWRPLNTHVDISHMNVYAHLVNRLDLNEESFGNEPKIVFLTLEDLESQKELIFNVNWSTILIDECQSLCNGETQTYDQMDKLFKHLRQKNVPCFKVFSTGTPIQNSPTDTISYLQLIEPQTIDEGLFKLRDIGNSMIKLQHDAAEGILTAAKDPNSEHIQFAYDQLKAAFCQIEGFKKLLNELTYICKRSDQEIIRQWGERMPGVVMHEHPIKFNEMQAEQKRLAEQIHELFSKNNRSASSEEKCFFSYAMQIGRTLLHPDLNVTEDHRKDLVQKLASKTPKEFREWAERSAILSYFLDDALFKQKIKKGVLLFVDQIAVGEILKLFIQKLFPEGSVDFLQGNTLENERRRMVLGFEKELDGKTRVLIMMDQAGSAGIDLKNNGEDVYLLNIGNFNPAIDKQALSRLARADSDKDQILVHTVNCGTPFESLVRWHKQRKEFDADYLFTWLKADFSNRSTLFKLLFESSSRLIRTNRYAEIGQAKIDNVWDLVLKLFGEDTELLEDLKLANPLNPTCFK